MYRWFSLGMVLFVLFVPEECQTASVDSLKKQIEILALSYPTDEVDWGIVIQDLSTGKVIYKRNEQSLLNPASNVKILTALAALTRWGPDFTFKTQLLGVEGEEKGTLRALILKGYGDPSFSTGGLDAMVRQLRKQGIFHVEQVYIDGTYLDGPGFPGLRTQKWGADLSCCVGAVPIDHHFRHLALTPGTKVGPHSPIRIETPSGEFPSETVSSGRRACLVASGNGEEEKNMSVKRSATYYSYLGNPISPQHPLKNTASALSQALQSEGIGAPSEVHLSCGEMDSEVLVENQSPHLKEILQEMNKNSDNFIAEQITKALGAYYLEPPGDTDKGISVIIDTLNDLGVNTGDITLENGSGLSRKSRMSAEILTQVLEKAYEDPKIRKPFLASLSVMGVDGTLKRKYQYSDLAGRFIGKTGTLRGVSSLSGYLYPRNSSSKDPYAFSFIVNGPSPNFWKLKEFSRDILEILLSGYQAGPDQDVADGREVGVVRSESKQMQGRPSDLTQQ